MWQKMMTGIIAGAGEAGREDNKAHVDHEAGDSYYITTQAGVIQHFFKTNTQMTSAAPHTHTTHIATVLIKVN